MKGFYRQIFEYTESRNVWNLITESIELYFLFNTFSDQIFYLLTPIRKVETNIKYKNMGTRMVYRS